MGFSEIKRVIPPSRPSLLPKVGSEKFYPNSETSKALILLENKTKSGIYM